MKLSISYSVLFLVFLSMASIVTYGQFASDEGTDEFPLFGGIDLTMGFTSRTLSTTDEASKDWLNDRNENENGQFGFCNGLSLQYEFSRFSAVQVGACFQNISYGSSFNETNLGDESIYDKLEVRYSFQYLQIPLAYSRGFGEKNRKWIVSGGPNFAFFLKSKKISNWILKDGDTGSRTESADFQENDMSIWAHLKIGREFVPDPDIRVRVGLNGNMNITPVNSADIIENHFSLGFYFAAFLRLG